MEKKASTPEDSTQFLTPPKDTKKISIPIEDSSQFLTLPTDIWKLILGYFNYKTDVDSLREIEKTIAKFLKEPTETQGFKYLERIKKELNPEWETYSNLRSTCKYFYLLLPQSKQLPPHCAELLLIDCALKESPPSYTKVVVPLCGTGDLPLISYGSIYKDKEILESEGTTVLHRFAKENQIELARKLLEKGAQINKQKSDGNTALHVAVEKDNKDMVKLLLEKGASIDMQNNLGETPLFIAAKLNNPSMLSLLLQHNPNVNILNMYNETALARASYKGYEAIVGILLDTSADVNVGDDLPLHKAARQGHTAIVKKLLQHKPNLDQKNKFGKTPLECAKNNEIAQLIKDADVH